MSPGARLTLCRVVEDVLTHSVLAEGTEVRVLFEATTAGLVTNITNDGDHRSTCSPLADLDALALHERARQAGGMIQVGHRMGRGTHVRLVLPWPE
jgi:signal transduction histidine kinase